MSVFALFLKSTILLAAILVFNVLVLTFTLSSFPNFLIANHNYIHHHQSMLSYLLTGDRGDLASILPPLELSHIDDVRNIYKVLPYFAIFLAIIIATMLKGRPLEEICKCLKYSRYFLIVIVLLTIPFFTIFFQYFHHALFPQGNWAFPLESILIQLYPEKFWLIALSMIILLSFIESICLDSLLKKISKSSSLSQR